MAPLQSISGKMMIPQGQGGEQGNPMMPIFCSLGQHRTLEAVDREMGANQHLMAFLDDIFFVTMPREVGEVHAVAQEKLWIHSCIRVVGKTKVWNRAGIRPLACDMLERIARVENPSATVWWCSDIHTADQGIKVLGAPLGHPDFVANLQRVEQEQPLGQNPSMFDVPSAWLLLLHCASANYGLSTLQQLRDLPEHTMRDCGSVCRVSFTLIQSNARRQSETHCACRCLWEVWGLRSALRT